METVKVGCGLPINHLGQAEVGLLSGNTTCDNVLGKRLAGKWHSGAEKEFVGF
jgi:hypothetical protein